MSIRSDRLCCSAIEWAETALRVVLALFAVVAVLAALTAPAAADPMRPLPSASAPLGAAPANAGFNLTQTGVPSELRADRLIAIRRDADGHRQALIGERWVAVGERVGGAAGAATLQALDDNRATLALGRQRLVLHLLPPLLASRGPAEGSADAAPSHPSPDATKPRRGAMPVAALQRGRPSPPTRTPSSP